MTVLFKNLLPSQTRLYRLMVKKAEEMNIPFGYKDHYQFILLPSYPNQMGYKCKFEKNNGIKTQSKKYHVKICPFSLSSSKYKKNKNLEDAKWLNYMWRLHNTDQVLMFWNMVILSRQLMAGAGRTTDSAITDVKGW